MLCGESSESLKEGREVSAVVTFAGSRDVLVRLPDFGDAEGVIPELAEDHAYPGQPRDRFVRDQPIRVRYVMNAVLSLLLHYCVYARLQYVSGDFPAERSTHAHHG